MGLHPKFPQSPYAPLIPEQRWFPADETMRATAYEKLLPPLVANVRKEVYAWRNKGYPGASPTSANLLLVHLKSRPGRGERRELPDFQPRAAEWGVHHQHVRQQWPDAGDMADEQRWKQL
jgi:hypothetical protein